VSVNFVDQAHALTTKLRRHPAEARIVMMMMMNWWWFSAAGQTGAADRVTGRVQQNWSTQDAGPTNTR